jgi:hypothetical protein
VPKEIVRSRVTVAVQSIKISVEGSNMNQNDLYVSVDYLNTCLFWNPLMAISVMTMAKKTSRSQHATLGQNKSFAALIGQRQMG